MTDRKHIEYRDSDGNRCVVDIEWADDGTYWVREIQCNHGEAQAMEHSLITEMFADAVLAAYDVPDEEWKDTAYYALKVSTEEEST